VVEQKPASLVKPQRGYIAVEGPIGVGKTSFARMLSEKLSARLVLDESGSNPFVARFYEDPDKFAFPAQLYFLLIRYRQQRELVQRELFSQATVCDYLFSKDRIFATLNLSPEELVLYEQIYKLLDAQMAKPDLVIYMWARSEVLIERLRRRNRDFERHISVEYLERLSAAYRDFFFYYEETPLLVVDTSAMDFIEHPGDLEELIREIERTHTGVQHYVPRLRSGGR
jgi:deoxyadenosine/deoxycytidine kinase